MAISILNFIQKSKFLPEVNIMENYVKLSDIATVSAGACAKKEHLKKKVLYYEKEFFIPYIASSTCPNRVNPRTRIKDQFVNTSNFRYYDITKYRQLEGYTFSICFVDDIILYSKSHYDCMHKLGSTIPIKRMSAVSSNYICIKNVDPEYREYCHMVLCLSFPFINSLATPTISGKDGSIRYYRINISAIKKIKIPIINDFSYVKSLMSNFRRFQYNKNFVFDKKYKDSVENNVIKYRMQKLSNELKCMGSKVNFSTMIANMDLREKRKRKRNINTPSPLSSYYEDTKALSK